MVEKKILQGRTFPIMRTFGYTENDLNSIFLLTYSGLGNTKGGRKNSLVLWNWFVV